MVIMSMISIVELLLLLSSIALITNASQLQKSCISEGMEIDAGKLSKTTWYSGLMKTSKVSCDSLISRLQKLDSKLFQRKMGPDMLNLNFMLTMKEMELIILGNQTMNLFTSSTERK
uniref:uncharacterized protein LOC120344024 n=1 Tax=Styela clava TaxID=7725 RepID=UPI001939F8E7|nr:uncharacterized protein LOC120344024 [Styela clava]